MKGVILGQKKNAGGGSNPNDNADLEKIKKMIKADENAIYINRYKNIMV